MRAREVPSRSIYRSEGIGTRLSVSAFVQSLNLMENPRADDGGWD